MSEQKSNENYGECDFQDYDLQLDENQNEDKLEKTESTPPSRKKKEFSESVSSEIQRNFHIRQKQLEIEERELEIREKSIRVEIHKSTIKMQMKLKIIQFIFKEITGLTLIIGGFFFANQENIIGPYMIGIGAAAAGINTKEIVESLEKKQEDLESKR